ncbi:MAG: DUF4123 domain-containing protein [Planctomycetota bacterium]|jgi:hypothetical protein
MHEPSQEEWYSLYQAGQLERLAESMSTVLFEEVTCESIREAVAQTPGTWYAILDACDAPNVLALVDSLTNAQESDPKSERLVQSMYSGKAAQQYRAIAPYLFTLTPDLLDWIVADLAGQPWGFLFHAELDFKSARKHFRNFVTVLDPQGEKMLFRFYDPRVLKMFVESANEQENQSFFGSCSQIVIPEGDRFLRLDHSAGADAFLKE